MRVRWAIMVPGRPLQYWDAPFHQSRNSAPCTVHGCRALPPPHRATLTSTTLPDGRSTSGRASEPLRARRRRRRRVVSRSRGLSTPRILAADVEWPNTARTRSPASWASSTAPAARERAAFRTAQPSRPLAGRHKNTDHPSFVVCLCPSLPFAVTPGITALVRRILQCDAAATRTRDPRLRPRPSHQPTPLAVLCVQAHASNGEAPKACAPSVSHIA